jgi:hypothetical protein
LAFRATTLLLAGFALLRPEPIAAAARGEPASDLALRDPLAIELGVVDPPKWERPADAARPLDAPELLLRTPPDSLVAALMDSTSLENMVATIQRLQDFGSRYVVVDSCWAAGYWVRDQFEDLGYTDVRLDTFHTMSFQDSVDAMNVIAVKQGVTRPSEYVVIGGHYDSVNAENFTDPYAQAPGAEDNATAVAAVFEAARLLRDVPTDRSIIFACWSAEEVGLWGSRAFVADAVEDSLDIVVYLNMDCIGYLEPSDEPPVIVFTDSLSLAIAGYMQTLAHTYTDFEMQTEVQPIGASDHTSFWEAGYRVVDTGTTVSSPYRHTIQDVIENIDPSFARSIAAVNVAATAAVAGIVGEDPNLPPETVRIANCAASSSPVTMRPTFEWDGVDFDGAVSQYEYAVESNIGLDGGDRPLEWKPLPAEQTSLTLDDVPEGPNVLYVRAVDDNGVVDPSPVIYEFTPDASLRPALAVRTNFYPVEFVFTGSGGEDRRHPITVYETERLVFTIASDATSYCGIADSVAFAVADTTGWSDWLPSPHELVLRPGPGDTAIHFRTRDENGATTTGAISLRTVPAPMELPLLHVDDWLAGGISDVVHDGFYAEILSGESCAVWDPFEHLVNYVPTLPSMEELGRYRTVLWTLDHQGGFLQAVQAESAYHSLEGFVRAGGNLILEGQASLLTLNGLDYYAGVAAFGPGDFTYEHVGVESLRNAGVSANPDYPPQYGYAFMGGTATGALGLPDAPVDTLGKWAAGYDQYGGLPYCDVVRPLPGTRRLYLFDSHINPNLSERPCATAHFPGDGTGSVAWFGFPLYYLQTAPAAEMLTRVLASMRSWQEAQTLSYFTWDSSPDSIALSWYLSPASASIGCSLERADSPSGEYRVLNSESILPGGDGRYRFTDGSVEELRTYSYRLVVTEQWGTVTTHGPWEVSTYTSRTASWLECASPNPFSGTTTISYGVAIDHQWVSVGVYDLAGRLVKTLREGPAQAGRYDVAWDGTNERGDLVGRSVYFVRARVGPESLERKIVFLR